MIHLPKVLPRRRAFGSSFSYHRQTPTVHLSLHGFVLDLRKPHNYSFFLLRLFSLWTETLRSASLKAVTAQRACAAGGGGSWWRGCERCPRAWSPLPLGTPPPPPPLVLWVQIPAGPLILQFPKFSLPLSLSRELLYLFKILFIAAFFKFTLLFFFFLQPHL